MKGEIILKIVKIIFYPLTKIKYCKSSCCKSECAQFDPKKDDSVFNEM